MSTHRSRSKSDRANGVTSAPDLRPVTVPDFLEAKKQGKRLTMLTAYDATFARLLDESGVDCLLVGDSLGMVVQGEQDSLGVSLEEMIYHTKLVVRGAKRALVVADMPFLTYQVSPQQALENAGRLIKEAGAHAVKLEGGARSSPAIRAISEADIPIIGHVGLTPQSVRRLGGFRVQRNEEQIIEDAFAVEKAGAFAIVIECVPAELATRLTKMLSIPTIGIGAGAGCDGQVLVIHDILGLFDEFRPRFVKRYANVGETIRQAVQQYCQEVKDAEFPTSDHEFR